MRISQLGEALTDVAKEITTCKRNTQCLLFYLLLFSSLRTQSVSCPSLLLYHILRVTLEVG